MNNLFECKDFMCTIHHSHIDKLHRHIVNSCIESGILANPQSKPAHIAHGKHIPGWNEYVEPKRQRSLMWHDIWKGQGSPRGGIIAQVMRKTRAEYHQAVKNVKREEVKIRNRKLANYVTGKDSRYLWKELKVIKGFNKCIPGTIDGVAGNKEIAQIFGNKFSKLYSSVSYNPDDMKTIYDTVISNINSSYLNKNSGSSCKCHKSVITVDDVCKAIKYMKCGKKDGKFNLFSGHLKNGTPRLYMLLSLLYSSMINHGYCPGEMLFGVMVPLPKVKGSNKSDDYRAITLGSIIGKLLDIILLNIVKDALETCNLQFGFKKGSSTTACTFIIQEVVSYFNDNNSDIYCTLLDASNAFDHLEFCTLFQKLLKLNICPLILRIFIYMYTNQLLAVKWNDVSSKSFQPLNGIKQGGVISPSLFCLYIDNLLKKLKVDMDVLLAPIIMGHWAMLTILYCYVHLSVG